MKMIIMHFVADMRVGFEETFRCAQESISPGLKPGSEVARTYLRNKNKDQS